MSASQSIFQSPENGAKLVAASTKFALVLYNDIAASTSGNIFFSPFSISIALAMTYMGAKGNTASQMKSGMCLDDINDSDLHQAFNDLRKSLKGEDGKYQLHVANRLFGQKTYKFLQQFLDATKTMYGAELAAVDFVEKRCDSVKLINDWVSKNTNDKITDLIRDDAVDDLTRLILVSAIYFKGNWLHQFDPAATKEEDFYVSAANTKRVPLMHKDKENVLYGCSEDLQCQAIALPYVEEALSIYILLPYANSSIAELQSKLNAQHISEMHKTFNMRYWDIGLWIPKFKLEEALDLKKELQKCGINDAFCEGVADFSGMDGDTKLYVSDVFHKAFIDVNEEGTEAAAATAVVMVMECAMIMDKIEFKADRPFLFFIRDNATGAILFLGDRKSVV